MEVILRDHVDNVGKRGDVVKVADGYARNYLLPRKLALPATDANKQWISRERKIAEAREGEERVAAEALSQGDPEPFVALFAEDAQWRGVSHGHLWWKKTPS